MKQTKMTARFPALLLAVLLLLTGCTAKREPGTPATQEETANVQIGTVPTDDFSMQYLRFGKGTQTFVILPGLSVQSVMGSAAAVRDAYAPLADACTIYLLEPRTDLPDRYTIADMADDAAAALEALGLQNVCLFGVSQGGMIAMETAICYPDLVHKLILGSTAARETETLAQTLETWVELAARADAEALYLAFGEALYSQEVFEQSRDLLTETAKTVTEQDLQRFVALASTIHGFDAVQELAAVSCPVLVIGDSDDRVLGNGASQQIAELLQGHTEVTLYMYEGYGHAVYDTAPDYKDRLLQFLSAS